MKLVGVFSQPLADVSKVLRVESKEETAHLSLLSRRVWRASGFSAATVPDSLRLLRGPETRGSKHHLYLSIIIMSESSGPAAAYNRYRPSGDSEKPLPKPQSVLKTSVVRREAKSKYRAIFGESAGTK